MKILLGVVVAVCLASLAFGKPHKTKPKEEKNPESLVQDEKRWVTGGVTEEKRWVTDGVTDEKRWMDYASTTPDWTTPDWSYKRGDGGKPKPKPKLPKDKRDPNPPKKPKDSLPKDKRDPNPPKKPKDSKPKPDKREVLKLLRSYLESH